jgi:hypothetical protein
MKIQTIIPNRTAGIPVRMNNHCQPARFALPFRKEILEHSSALVPYNTGWNHDHLPTGEETAEGTSNSDRSCKNSQARGSLRWLVPVTQIHDDTGEVSNSSRLPTRIRYSPRKEASLCDAQEEPNGKQTLEVGDSCGADCDDAPRDHDAADPDRGREVLHREVRRRFEEHIRHEEHCDSDVVAVSSKAELSDNVV